MQYITYYIGMNVYFFKKCNLKPISLYTITTKVCMQICIFSKKMHRKYHVYF